MRIVIYGADNIGQTLVSFFATEENDVIVIDEDAERIKYINEHYDVKAVVGRGSYPDILEQLNISSANLFIAASSCDEYNMIACQVAGSLFQIPIKIAYLHNSHYLGKKWESLFNPLHIPIDHIIFPELSIARSIAENFEIPHATEVIPVGEGGLRIISLRCAEESPLGNVQLSQIADLFSHIAFRILCVVREGRYRILTRDDAIMPHDEVYMLAQMEDTGRILSAFGYESCVLKQAVIFGGGNVGFNLAKILTEKFSNVHVNLIEHSQKRAAFVAGALPNVTVFHGSALDHNMLKEAAVPEADTVISVMDDDENNVLAGLLSKNLGANFINVLVSNPLYPTILPALGIDAVINPKTITISDVLQYIPTFNVKFIHTFRDHFGSVCKVRLGPNNKFVGKYLRSLTVPDKSILGGVIREGQFMIPDYPDVAQVGDIIIFLVVRSEVQEMKKIFKDH